jgi:3-hydroxybutyryl-CoA dehydratase
MNTTYSKTIAEADILMFAAASGNNNALHINEEYAATMGFRGRISHGFLYASAMSAAVVDRLPGAGTVYLTQQM